MEAGRKQEKHHRNALTISLATVEIADSTAADRPIPMRDRADIQDLH
jgi:hypothetical protein